MARPRRSTKAAERPSRRGAADAARIEHVSKSFGRPGAAAARPGRHHPRCRARRVRHPPGGLGLRQVDAAQPGRRPGPADRRDIETPGGRPALMFQEHALFPWLTAGKNIELALRLRGVPQGRAARPRPSGCCELVRLGGRVRQAGARAVRRHAAARRAGPRAGPGQPAAADGRAVRRARRHHPRCAARRADPDLGGDRASPSCSSPTTCARRYGSPQRVVLLSSRPGPDRPRVGGRHPAAAPDRGRGRGRTVRRDHRTTAWGDPPPWPALRPAEPSDRRPEDVGGHRPGPTERRRRPCEARAAVDLAGSRRASTRWTPRRARTPRAGPAAQGPAAGRRVALVLVVWQLAVWAEVADDYKLPSPAAVWDELARTLARRAPARLHLDQRLARPARLPRSRWPSAPRWGCWWPG